jgi:RNA polymerase sigma factor (sigma-70 family)
MELRATLTEMAEAAPGAQEAELVAAFAGCRQRAQWIALDIVGEPEEAADLVHEAFLRVKRALPRFRGECTLRTYLLRVVVNLALKAVRRRAVRERLRHLLPFGRAVATPEHLASCAEEGRRLAAAMAQLPGQQRAAFVLRHAHDLPLREVAQVLHVSEATAKTHLLRAVQRLRRALEEER